MNAANDIAEFLATRRARIAPEQAGLLSYGKRRVPGLRREEVASLAGVSAGEVHTTPRHERNTGR